MARVGHACCQRSSMDTTAPEEQATTLPPEQPEAPVDVSVPESSESTKEAVAPSASSRRAPRPSLPPQKGTTVFPLARVSKIIKADSAVDICSKEATFLISAATVCRPY